MNTKNLILSGLAAASLYGSPAFAQDDNTKDDAAVTATPTAKTIALPVLPTEKPDYCVDLKLMEIPEGAHAWNAVKALPGVDDNDVAQWLMADGQITQCTLWKNKDDADVLEAMINSDTVYVTAGMKDDKPFYTSHEGANIDGILFDTLPEGNRALWTPGALFEGTPVEAPLRKGYLLASEFDMYAEAQAEIDGNQWAAIRRHHPSERINDAIEETPKENTPVDNGTKSDNKVYGGVALGPHYITENGETHLNGFGGWVEAELGVKVGEKGAFELEINRARLSKLTYTDGSGNVLVGDGDVTLAYIVDLNDTTSLGFGVNADARTAGVEYAGIGAQSGQFAVGPEASVDYQKGKTELEVRAGILFGQTRTNVDIDGFDATRDMLTKLKTEADLEYAVSDRVTVGARALVESDLANSSSQDGGVIAKKGSTTLSVGPTLGYG